MIAVKFLALFLYISVTMSFQLDPEESAKEKAKATLFGLDYLKGHCILTEDYDNILICSEWKTRIECNLLTPIRLQDVLPLRSAQITVRFLLHSFPTFLD